MKKLLILLTIFAFWANAKEKKKSEKDLLFHVSFDRWSVTADTAKGNPQSIDFKKDLEFRPVEGMNDKNAFLRTGKETLTYDAKKNFNPVEGTLSIWIKAVNWKPGGEGLKPVGFKHFFSVRFKNKQGKATLTLYKYYTQQDFAFLITTKLNKDNWLAKAPGSNFKQGQWLKLDATWREGEMTFYINAKKYSRVALEDKYQNLAKAGLSSGKIMINPILWGGKHEPWSNQTAIDEVKIYGRALSEAEIFKKFKKDGGNTAGIIIKSIQIDGVDRNDGVLDRMNARIDLNTLDDFWQKAINVGRVQASYSLSLNGDKVFVKKDKVKSLRYELELSGAILPGKYDFLIKLSDRVSGKTKTISSNVEKPDLSFYDNQFGKEDFLPKPWTPIIVKGNKVSVWNRTYKFDGPFVRQINVKGKLLLKKGVKLFADSGDGLQAFTFTPGKTIQKRKDSVILTGKGVAGKITLEYKNTIWFDGYTRSEIKITSVGKSLKKLTLTYKMKKQYAKHLMTPTRQKFMAIGNSFEIADADLRGFTQLWLIGKVNGFCWVPEDKGNWVNKKGEKPIHVKNGQVRLNIISKPVIIPKNLTYVFGFIATPSRPLPKGRRTFNSGGGWGIKNTRNVSIGWGGRGFTGYATLEPATKEFLAKTIQKNKDLSLGKNKLETLEEFLKVVAKKQNRKSFPYFSPTSVVMIELYARYFKYYWNIPGKGNFTINDVYKNKYHQVFVTNTKIMKDMFAAKLENFFLRKDSLIGGVYYDLDSVFPNRSKKVLGAFVDAFGQKIKSRLNTVGLRECHMRTLKICRKYGKLAWYHGHNRFNPAIHALGDYWFPGEFLATALSNNRYFYIDEMPQTQYDTDFNSAQKGVGILNLPVIGRHHKERRKEPRPTESMLGVMLLNDISSTATQCHQPTLDKMWSILIKSKIDDAQFIKFTENKDFKSSNENIFCSFYKFSDGRVLAIVVNKNKTDAKVNVEFKGGFSTAYDEWNKKNVRLRKGKVKLLIKGRMFSLLLLKKIKK